MTPRHHPSPNHDARPDATIIDTLILHYTGMKTAAAAIDRLCSPAAAVSAHYVVEEDGQLWQLVPEEQRAWHAGISCWRGRHNLNSCSIGIEIVNPGHEFGYRPFPATQMRAVLHLCQAITTRHTIDPRNIIAHSDAAPNRKQDPGELFDWQFLAQEGIGLWPDAQTHATPAPIEPLLASIGYDITLPGCVAAFQRHWRNAGVDGIVDDETCFLASAVEAKARGVAPRPHQRQGL